MLFITRGYTAPETIEAAERAEILAEKSGNLRQLFNLIIARGISVVLSGDLSAGSALADRALEIAVREASPSVLGRAHLLQMMAHYYSGDLVGAEKHFTTGFEFFEHPSFRRIPGVAVAAFNYGSWTSWMLGRNDVAREREARMIAVADATSPHEMAFSRQFAAQLRIWMRKYEQAEALAGQALELAEKHQFPAIAVDAQWSLGHARAQLGHVNEGIGMMRQAIAATRAGRSQTGATGLGYFAAWLAVAQERAGASRKRLKRVSKRSGRIKTD
jgi:tetratricopeptide (TPR) repeat protein